MKTAIYLFAFMVSTMMSAVAQDPDDDDPDAPNVRDENWKFRVPEGWERKWTDSQSLVIPPNLPEGRTAAIIIMKEQKLESELKDWHAKEWEKLTGGFAVLSGGEAKEGKTPRGYAMADVEAKVRDGTGAEFHLYLAAFKSKGRVFGMMFLSNVEDKIEEHRKSVEGVVRSLMFEGGIPPPVVTPRQLKPTPSFTWGQVERPKGTAGLDGTYAVFTNILRYNAILKRLVAEKGYKLLTFFADGCVYFGLPEEGLENFKYEYWEKKYPLCRGTYKLAGGEGEVVTGDPDLPKSEMTIKGEEIQIGDMKFQKLDPLNGLVLEGTFRRSDHQLTGHTEGITLKKDRTFKDEGVLHRTSAKWWLGNDNLVDNGAPGEGKYRIANNTLELIFQDGRKRRIAFWVAPGTAKVNPDLIWINNYAFVPAK